jgi:hypothetical protein
MNREVALQVADAIMYEGYSLYPYRPSALKNRQRWTFGILYPPDYEEVQRGTERNHMHSEVLIRANATCELDVELRFLELMAAQAGLPEEAAVPRSFEFRCKMGERNRQSEFTSGDGLRGVLAIRSESLAEGLFKVAVDVTNATRNAAGRDRDSALLRSFLSAHLILSTHEGEFVSLLDPPEDVAAHVSSCWNVATFPVLVGVEGERDMMLCSPIILYDYPQIASESAGDFFDSTEMDEMLTLRVMTLTDEEKEQMRLGDSRVRNLLDRTERSARTQLTKTHGVIRSMRPSTGAGESMDWNSESQNAAVESVTAFGVVLKRGDRVRLWPQKTADIMDMALKGKVAIIEAIERDFDDKIHVATVLEDDPGRDLGMLRQPGHRFFFSPEELEPLSSNGEVSSER